MDFKFSEADEAFRLEFRSWLEKNTPRDWRDEDELADPDTKSEFERRRTWHRKLYDGGASICERYGGLAIESEAYGDDVKDGLPIGPPEQSSVFYVIKLGQDEGDFSPGVGARDWAARLCKSAHAGRWI